MDPPTIVQILDAIMSLGDVVIKCSTRLSALKAQFHDAPMIVTSMIGQLHMVKTAQDQLAPLNSPKLNHDPRYRQLADQIGNALDSFGPILLALGQQLDRYEGIGPGRTTAESRMGPLKGEREMTNLSILLDRQANALKLLLQAIQCHTWTQQSDIITREESQSVLRLAKDCSSSLVGLEDVASFISENRTPINTQFEFDDVPRSTLLYQAAERSNPRQDIQGKKIRDRDKISTSSLAQKPAMFGLKQAFQAMRLSRPITGFGTIDTQRGIRVDIRRDVIAESSADHVITEGDSIREDSSHSSSRDVDGINPGTETSQQTEPLLSGIDLDTPRPHSGLGTWRNTFQRRASNARETKQEASSQLKMVKVLLLGASGGGKTTLLNALQLCNEAERVRHDESYLRTLVWQNALDSARAVLRAMEELEIDSELTVSARRLLLEPCTDCDRDPALNPQHAVEVATNISRLRLIKGFEAANWRNRWGNTYQFHDNRDYYIQNINRLAEQAAQRSVATDGDLLRTQVTTTGIHQVNITYQGSQFCVYDVGGERSERKKWIHAFQDVSAVIYPVDTTGYGRCLREDVDGDRMHEQFMVFESIANSGWFARSSFVVVFTKMDLLAQYLEEEDVGAFLRIHGLVPETEPRITVANDYLGHLEKHFRGLVRSADVRERMQFVRANLVDVDKHNSAIDILNTLKSLIPSKRASTFGKKVSTPTGEKDRLFEKRVASKEIDESSEYSTSSPL